MTVPISLLWTSNIYSAPYLADVVASPSNIESCISDSGINPMSQQLELKRIDIAGPLPFIRSYSTMIHFTPHEYNQAYHSPMDRDLREMGVGWTHNYAYKLEEGVAIPFNGVIPSLRLFLPEEGKFITFLIRNGEYIRSSGAPYWGTITDSEIELVNAGQREIIARYKGIEILFHYQSNNGSFIAKKISYPNGKVVLLNHIYDTRYSRWLLSTVNDNRGNGLQIYHDENPDFRGSISGVQTTNTNLRQQVIYSYKLGNMVWPSPFFMYVNKQDNVYSFNKLPTLVSARSSISPAEDYNYSDYAKNAKINSSVSIPVMVGLIQENKLRRKWEYSHTSIASEVPGIAKRVKMEIDGNILSVYRQLNANQDKTDKYITDLNLLNSDVGSVPNTVLGNDERFSRIRSDGTTTCLTYNNIPIKNLINANSVRKISSIIDQNGNRTDFKYDQKTRLIEENAAKGTPVARNTFFSYASQYWTPSTIKQGGMTLINTLNNRGWITSSTQKSTSPQSTDQTTNYEYLENGLLSSYDGPRNGIIDKTYYTYDNNSNISSVSRDVNGARRVTNLLEYNSLGMPGVINYASGIKENLVFNNDGTIAKKTTSGGVVSKSHSYLYDEYKRIISETDPAGEKKLYNYNFVDQLVNITLPNGSKIIRDYLTNGMISSEKVIDSSGNVFSENSVSIDSNGRPVIISQGGPSGFYQITNTYDANGNIIQARNSLGTIEKWTYDSLNRTSSNTDGMGGIYKYDYDVHNNLIGAKDPLGSGTNPFKYRNGNILSEEVNSDYGVRKYGYESGDILNQIISGSRKCNFLNIDSYERLGKKICTSPTTYLGNSFINNVSYKYDVSKFGNLDSIVSDDKNYGVNEFFVYDSVGRLIKKTQTSNAVKAWGGTEPTLSVEYGYMATDKLLSLKLPSGRLIKFNYDLNKKSQIKSISLDEKLIINNIKYSGAGFVSGWNWGVGNSYYNISFDINKNPLIKSINNYDGKGVVNYGLNYEYDKSGRVIKLTRNNGTIDDFSYDSLDRLISESRRNSSGSVFNINYSYDKNGNRIKLLATGSHQQKNSNSIYTYNGNKLLSINGQNVQHNEDAELIYGSFQPVYDNVGNRRAEKTNESSTSPRFYMTYNDKNQRTVRGYTSNGADWKVNTIQFIYDESGHLLGEYNANGVPLVEYIWLDNKPIAAIYGSSAQIYWIVSDANNTPRRLINSSNGSSVVWSWDSTAFGVGKPEIENVKFRLRFPGQVYDDLTNQFYNHNRFYNPDLGRYMEPDPSGLIFNPNPYAYANNNPVMYVDPTGEHPVLIAMGIGAGVSSGIYVGTTAVESFVDALNGKGKVFEIFSNRFTWNELGQQAVVGAAFGGVGKAAFLAADVHVVKTAIPETSNWVQKMTQMMTNTAINKQREITTSAGIVITSNVLLGKTTTNLALGNYNEQSAIERMNRIQQINQQFYESFNYTQPNRVRLIVPKITTYAESSEKTIWQKTQDGFNKLRY